MRRQLQHIIKSEEYLTSLTLPEPSVIGFKVRIFVCFMSDSSAHQVYLLWKVECPIPKPHLQVEHLQCKVSINPDNSFQSLHLKVVPDDPNQWKSDQLLIIQKFFDAKVVAPPYRPTFLSGFCRLLHCPQVFKTFHNTASWLGHRWLAS